MFEDERHSASQSPPFTMGFIKPAQAAELEAEEQMLKGSFLLEENARQPWQRKVGLTNMGTSEGRPR